MKTIFPAFLIKECKFYGKENSFPARFGYDKNKKSRKINFREKINL